MNIRKKIKAPTDSFTIGILASISTTFIMFTMNVFAKLAAPEHSSLEIAFWRNFLAFLPVFGIVLWQMKGKLPPLNRPRAMISRSILGTVAITLTFAAYASLPMADANVIILSSSLLLAPLAHFFLGEKITRSRFSAVLIGMIGVLIVLQPTGQLNPWGATLAISSAICAAVMRTLLRHLGKNETPISMTFYFLMIGTVITSVPLFINLLLPFISVDLMNTLIDSAPAIFKWTMPTEATIWLLIGTGVCGAIGQYMNAISFKHTEASLIGIFVYTQLIWALPYDWLIWNHAPALTTLIGGGIIVGSNIFIILRERHKNQRAKAAQAALSSGIT